MEGDGGNLFFILGFFGFFGWGNAGRGELQISDCRIRISDFGFEISGWRFRIWDFRFRIGEIGRSALGLAPLRGWRSGCSYPMAYAMGYILLPLRGCGWGGAYFILHSAAATQLLLAGFFEFESDRFELRALIGRDCIQIEMAGVDCREFFVGFGEVAIG